MLLLRPFRSYSKVGVLFSIKKILSTAFIKRLKYLRCVIRKGKISIPIGIFGDSFISLVKKFHLQTQKFSMSL